MTAALMKRLLLIAALVGAAALLIAPVTTLYFETGRGARCASCHEMQTPFDEWRNSSHRAIGCEKCHGGAFTTDASFHLNNARRAWSHVRGDLPEQIVFDSQFAQDLDARCESCHRQEYAAWKSGPHSATFARIFLDKKFNAANMPIDDCLRCHGMNYQGGIGDLVTPVDRTGPWRLKSTELTDQPSMPCLTCHAMHREGQPMMKAGVEGRVPGPSQEVSRPSLAFFDRRTQRSIPIAELPMPVMLEGSRLVRMSRDQRQALCYQCHAPVSTMQVGTGDDRTGLGVHEGISCLACHQQHGQKTKASCATCHPKMSNCGLDVEKMDTTFASADSRHNIHWVKCADCHTKGVPKKKARELAAE